MFSVQKLLGKEENFFKLLVASAEEVCRSVHALEDLSKNLDQRTRTEESAFARHKDREITEEITAAIYTTFVTAIEREDIHALSNALYRITKTVDKFTERAFIAPHYVQGLDFSKQIALLEAASDIVLQLVQSLRTGLNPKHVSKLIEELRLLENQADKLMPALYQELFSGRYGAVQIIFLKDLYELLEKAIDCCRSAGNVISRIVLKSS